MKTLLLSIPPSATLEELRKNVLIALQKVVSTLPDPTDLANQRIMNVGDPAATTDAATKGYVDSQTASATAAPASPKNLVRGASNLSTAGYVPYVKAPGTLGIDKPNFFWDSTNHRLGIGLNTPAYPLDVVGQAQVSGDFHGGARGLFTSDISSGTKYIAAGNNGLTSTITPASSVTLSTAANGVFGTPAAGQSNGVVVTGVTLNFGTSRQFTGGILTT